MPPKKSDPTNLPPAGYEREEELKQRIDALEQREEELSNQLEVQRIDPKVFEEDREILNYLDVESGNFPIQNPQDEYVYCWTYRDPLNKFGAQQIMRKRVQGWNLIKRGMPEGKGYQYDASNNMYVGDVVAMRIRKDLWLKLKVAEIERLRRVQKGITSNLHQAARDASRRTGHHIEVRESLDDRTVKAMQNRADAARIGEAGLREQLGAGTMPGAGVDKLTKEGKLK